MEVIEGGSWLPATSWARVLRFVGEAQPAVVCHALREAAPLAVAELADQHPGVAAFSSSSSSSSSSSPPSPPSLAAAFAGALLFPDDEAVGGHFSTRKPVVAAFFRACEHGGIDAPLKPSLPHFALWLFDRPDLQSLVRQTRAYPRTMSFGLVRQAGWQPSWEVSRATAMVATDTDTGEQQGSNARAASRDLLCALHAVARALAPPNFPYLWIHVSRAEQLPRRKFVYPRRTFLVSLPGGRGFEMGAGAVADEQHCALETMVSFNVPVEPREVPPASKGMLKNAGFDVDASCS